MAKAPRQQRLGLDHIAFYRGWMEGTIDLGHLATRYLETGDDLRAARRTLKAIEQALISACRRMGKPSDARLIRLNSTKLRAASQVSTAGESPAPDSEPVPSFEAYQQRVDPDGFWSVNDLYEEYQQTYAQQLDQEETSEDRRKARALRLIQRRNALILNLEKTLAETPKADHDIRGWLDESLSNRLAAAGFITVGSIIEHANQAGYHWYRSAPGLGKTKATKVIEFLRRHEDSIGLKLTPYALTPPRQLPSDKLALEAFQPTSLTSEEQAPSPFSPVQDGLYVPPEQLDGSRGLNRASTNYLQARNDWDAIQKWLNTFKGKAHTQRNYRKEVERLLLWAIFERQTAFSSMTTDDVVAFGEFLADPQPQERWTCERTYRRTDPRWRPFIKRLPAKADRLMPGEPGYAEMKKQAGLSPKSIDQSMSVCRALCSWLTEQGYLDYNPFLGFSKAGADITVDTGRSFTRRQWGIIMRALDEMDQSDVRTMRLRFTLRLAYATGLRLSELVKATTGDIVLEEDIGGDVSEAYFLNVVGKRNVRRSVPLPKSVRQCLSQYLAARGLSPNPLVCDKQTPLIAKLYSSHGGTAMTPAALYEVLSKFFMQISAQIPDDDGHGRDARRFFQASTHWLRHTHGTHALSYGADINIVKENMGHKSLTTTSLYVKPERRLQLEQMEAFDQAVFAAEPPNTQT